MRKHEGIMRHSKEPGHVPKQPTIPTVHMPRNTKTKNNREYRAIGHSAAYTQHHIMPLCHDQHRQHQNQWHKPRLSTHFNRIAGGRRPFLKKHHFDLLKMSGKNDFLPPKCYLLHFIQPNFRRAAILTYSKWRNKHFRLRIRNFSWNRQKMPLKRIRIRGA